MTALRQPAILRNMASIHRLHPPLPEASDLHDRAVDNCNAGTLAEMLNVKRSKGLFFLELSFMVQSSFHAAMGNCLYAAIGMNDTGSRCGLDRRCCFAKLRGSNPLPAQAPWVDRLPTS